MPKTRESRRISGLNPRIVRKTFPIKTARISDFGRRSVTLSFFVIFIMSIFMGQAYGESSSYLPVTHRAYDFIEQMDHRFQSSGTLLGTKPATRREIALIIFSLVKHKALMTRVESTELDCLLNEFSGDFFPRNSLVWDDSGPVDKMPDFLKGFLYRNRRNMYSSFGDDYSLYLDPVVVRKARLGTLHGSSGDDNVYTSGNGFILRGTIGEHLGFHIDIRDSKEWGSRDYPETTTTTLPGRGWAAFKGDRAEFDETYAHLTYTAGPFLISYGRDRNVWGRGRNGTLIISDYGAPYDMLRLQTVFGGLKFMFFTAEIEQYPPVAKFYYSTPSPVPPDSVTVKKYISGHRIELKIGNRLNIGLHETVVFGGRWDFTYLNPVMFLKGGEHANGDHDNAALGMDFRYFLHRSHSVYGELLIDDITTTKLGTDWYGNKLAYQVGSFIVQPFGLRDVDTRIEYTRINPWVYTHRYTINSYTHYGDVLGHRSGPNSDELLFEIRKRFSRRLHTGFSVLKWRHGANMTERNVGGDPLEGFQPGDSKKAGFLDGDRKDSTAIGIDISYEIMWELLVRFGYTYEKYDGDNVNIYRFSLGLNE